ncbi:UDP-glucose 4-epimerase [Methanohalophilus levihalophilus]|uniref:NAD-dependent epimerase/dehydratase family protein n=1 Tax=Methanohalophilus levihalophilus TaxID=1431282 RepID=UPI001AE42CA5|nr:NAD-dependent epimerase/dehydratase family protein [Methanohalophilus levihalophilus]MBP2029949.1 UDP-glucose 4-epimerase [Methanohalophilus levihalophilus]
MKALVTGCAGFIGSHITESLLEKGIEVVGIDCFTDYYPRRYKENNLKNAQKNKNFTLFEEDILSLEEFPEVDYIFHQAAQAGVRKSWGSDFSQYTSDNILVTQKLLEYYKNKSIKKFVYASSSSVYGDAGLPMKEDLLLKPVSPYGVTKLAAENLCYLYYKNYGIPTVSLRYFTVYGPRQRPEMAIHLFVKAILGNELITVYGDGKQTRDFTYVSDIVDANLKAAFGDVEGEVFNVGGGTKISVNELIRILEENIGMTANVEYIEKQKGDVNDTLADSNKIRILGWEPSVKIHEGIGNFVKWYKGLG